MLLLFIFRFYVFRRAITVLYVCASDVQLETSLDIAINHFGMVGGQDDFVAECGGESDGGAIDILSRKHKNFTRVYICTLYIVKLLILFNV